VCLEYSSRRLLAAVIRISISGNRSMGVFSYNIPTTSGTLCVKALTRGWGLDRISQRRPGSHWHYIQAHTLRPDLVAGPEWIENPNLAGGRQLNPAAFVVPSAATQGDLGRNALRGFELVQADFSARRSFRIREVSLAFRVDLLNSVNHPNFANPVASTGPELLSLTRRVKALAFRRRLSARARRINFGDGRIPARRAHCL
jgi:hypothetical protein